LAGSLAVAAGCSDDSGGGGDEGGSDVGSESQADVGEESTDEEDGTPGDEGDAGTTDEEDGASEGEPDTTNPEGGSDDGGSTEEEGEPDADEGEEGEDAEGGDESPGEEGGGEGTLCELILDCAQGCDGEEGCVSTCATGQPESAAAKFEAVASCADASRCADLSDEACLAENCAAELDACSAVEVSCRDILFCRLGCFDEACQQACEDDVTGSGAEQLAALDQCLDAICTKPISNECLSQGIEPSGDCVAEGIACLPEDGNKACPLVTDCLTLCAPGDVACEDACLNDGSRDAQVVAIPFYQCLQDSCPYDGGYEETCVLAAQNQFCGSAWAVCFDQL
jgi:hypothetical protein